MRSGVLLRADIRRLPWLARDHLVPAERVTLDIATTMAVAALAAGLQFGGWPLWTVPVAAAGYLAWVLLYSEATIQVSRRRLKTARSTATVLATEAPAPPG